MAKIVAANESNDGLVQSVRLMLGTSKKVDISMVFGTTCKQNGDVGRK